MLGAGEEFWTFVAAFPARVAADLGMDVLGFDPASTLRQRMLSLENLDEFEQADLIVVQNPDDPTIAAPTFQRLPAVRAGRLATLDYADVFGFALTATDLVGDLVAAARLLG